MKLNIYCFNDLLIYLEENLVFENKPNSIKDIYKFKSIDPQSICESLAFTKKYSFDEIYYALLMLKETELIKTTASGEDVIGSICDITWNGHKYLNNEIRRGYLPY